MTEKSAELKAPTNKKGSLKKSEERSGERRKAVWNEKVLPVSCEWVLEQYGHYLTRYEQQ